MKVVFDRSFDGGAWPGPLAERDAAMGESWLGELGMLGLLETMVGLAGVHLPVSGLAVQVEVSK